MAATSGVPTTQPTGEWPMELRALFAALTKPAAVSKDRRSRPRAEYRDRAVLRIVPAKQTPIEVEIFLRDYDDRAVSFVARDMVAVHRNIELELTAADGTRRRIACRVGRCRQFREGWFEGVLYMAR